VLCSVHALPDSPEHIAIYAVYREYVNGNVGSLPWDALVAWRSGLALLYTNTQNSCKPSPWVALVEDRVDCPGEFPEDAEWQSWVSKDDCTQTDTQEACRVCLSILPFKFSAAPRPQYANIVLLGSRWRHPTSHSRYRSPRSTDTRHVSISQPHYVHKKTGAAERTLSEAWTMTSPVIFEINSQS
jgi:hypothetical protein